MVQLSPGLPQIIFSVCAHICALEFAATDMFLFAATTINLLQLDVLICSNNIVPVGHSNSVTLCYKVMG